MLEDRGLYSIGIMTDGYVYAVRPSEVADDDVIILDRISKYAWQDFEQETKGKAAIQSGDADKIVEEFERYLPFWKKYRGGLNK